MANQPGQVSAEAPAGNAHSESPRPDVPETAERPALHAAAPEAVTLAPAVAAVAGVQAGGSFAEYDLLQEIARGGMGVVYKARHRRLGRTVALKMILAGQLASREEIQRFQSEASSAARLDHPGIVPIYEVGCHQGQHYFSMGFVEGEHLAQRIARGPMEPQEAARIACQVAGAVQYAHDHGTIHRDLKPSNILLDSRGQPRVTDFGLARQVEAGSHLTGSGQILGTPSFMPPEQAAGHSDRAGPLADVYSLGAVLYAAITGRPPFQSANPIDTLLQVLDSEPVAPSQLNPNVPRDLETICLKCLHKEPLRRYASARALAEDLQRFLQGRPIAARPVSALERAWRWHRRNRLLSWSIISAVAVLVAASVISTLFGIAAVAARNTAQNQTALARQQERAAERNLRDAWRNYYAASMNLAQTSWEAGDVGRVLELLAPFTPSTGALPDVRGWEWHYQMRLCQAGQRSLAGIAGLVFAAAYHPTSGELAIGSENSVTLWDPASGQMRRRIAVHNDLVTALCFSADGARLASASRDGTVMLSTFSDDSGQAAKRLPALGAPVRSLALDRAGGLLVAGMTDQRLVVWRVDSGQTESFTTAGHEALRAVAVSPDGKFLASGGTGGTISLGPVADPRAARRLQAGDQPIECLCFAGDNLLCSAGSDSVIRLWDCERGLLVGALSGHAQGVFALCAASAASAAGLLASGGADGTVRVWDLAQHRLLHALRGHNYPVRCVALDPTGARLASSGLDARVRLWDLAAQLEHRSERAHQGPVTSLVFDAGGTRLYSAGADGRLLAWNAETLEHETLLEEPGVPLYGVALADGAGVLMAAAGDGHVRAGSINQAQPWRSLPGHAGRVSSVATTPHAGLAASGSWDGTVRVWDLETGAAAVLRGHESYVHAVAVDASGRFVASAGQDATVRIWIPGAAEPMHRLLDPESYVLALAFDPAGEFLVAGCWDGAVVVWDLARPERFRRLLGHRGRVHSVGCSPDGQRLVSASADQTIKIWDAATGQELRTLAPAGGVVYAAAWDPGNQRLAAGCADGRILVWDSRGSAPADAAGPEEPAESVLGDQAYERMRQARYEFGWAAGESNGDDELSVSFYGVTGIERQGEELVVRYDWKEGFLRGQLRGQTLRGSWRQQNGRGEVFLRFDADFTRASGWWNEGGNSPRHAAFLRHRRPEP